MVQVLNKKQAEDSTGDNKNKEALQEKNMQLKQAIADLDETEAIELIQAFLSTEPSVEEAEEQIGACQDGMVIVGDLYDQGEYYIGDLIFAGELLQEAIDLLKPFLGGDSTESIGTVVLGTAQGDLHDIGKNIFKSMMEVAGFEVHDLGTDVSPDTFVESVRELKPDVLGISGLLTVAVEGMKSTVQALTEADLRNSLKIIVGGATVNEAVCEMIGADAFTLNASEGAKICMKWGELNES